MECYQTCVDKGKKCTLQREKISCYECGKVKPYYNIPVDDSKLCPPPEPCDYSAPKEEKEKPPPKPKEFCNCKQSCWNWILSFIGVGGELPDCCKDVPLTPWESGSSARQALVTKVRCVVSRASGLGTSPRASSPPKTDPKIEQKESVKKTLGTVSSAEKETRTEGATQVSSEQASGKDPEVATEKKSKSAKSHSTTSNRGRSRKRKSTISKSRSSSREKRVKKSSSKTRSVSSSSSGGSVGDKRRKSRSRSRSSVKVFNPFKRKPSVCTCPSSCSIRSGVCPPLPCLPQTQSRSYLTRVNEEQSSGLAQKCNFTSAYTSQIPSIASRPLRRSLSMSCKPSEKCVKPAPAGNCQKTQGTGSTKNAGRSQSFHTTLLNSPTLRPVVIPSFNPLCSCCSPSPRKSTCSCTSEDYSCKSKNSPKPSCIPTKTPQNSPQSFCRACGKQKSPVPAMTRRSTCSCQSPSKSSSRGCTQASPKPCYQPSSNKPNTAPCSPSVNQRQPKCMQSSGKVNQCPCPPSGPCTCTKKKGYTEGSRLATRNPPRCTDPLTKPACLTATAISYVKAKQNDAICQQLLAKYGFSPPPRRLCPNSCFGTYSEGICTTYSSCMSSSPRCSGIGGCKACRPSAGEHGTGASRPSENYTNSRKPRSPEREQIKQQEIQFNSSPCERQSISEFQLPPHCIRETGPRSPVDEYLAILRLPKPVRRPLPEPVTADANQEKPTESADRPNDEKETKEKSAGKVTKKQKKKSGKEESKNEDENASAINDNSSVDSTVSCCTGEMFHPEAEDIPILVSDCNPPEDVVCCNNNYGGQSFCYSPFSSAGPVQIDFGELNTYNGSYSGLPSQSSAASIKTVRNSTPTYRLSNSSFEVHATSSFVSHMLHSYSVNSGDLSGNVLFGNRGYSDRSVNNLNINAQKSHIKNRPLSFARSSNSFGMEVPGNKAYGSSRFHENLEREIKNKIKELREMGIFESPSRRSYVTTFSTPAASTTRALHVGSDPLNPGLNRDRLNQKSDTRRWQTTYISKYGRFPEATGTTDTAEMINKAELLPQPCQPPRDKSFNKMEMVTDHCQQKPTITRKVKETMKQKDEPQLNASNPRRKIKEQRQLEAAQVIENVKLEKKKPSPRRECVFQSLFGKLEETVQIFVRQKKCDDGDLGNVHKPIESEQQLTIDVRGNKEIIVGDETVSSHWIEENQSSNKLDKSTANVRPLLANNSPPHKPALSKSSDLKNSASPCCSCHTNSPGTSSVSLEITGSVQSSEDLSESCSILDTSPSYTKLSRLDRISNENLCTPVNKPCTTATRPAQLTKTTDNSEKTNRSNKIIDERKDQTCHGDTPNSCLPPRFYQACDDTGSSVDPVATDAGDSNTGHKSEDDYELEDARYNKSDPYKNGKTTKQHVIRYQDSPADDEPMSELMREFIRRNGTPV